MADDYSIPEYSEDEVLEESLKESLQRGIADAEAGRVRPFDLDMGDGPAPDPSSEEEVQGILEALQKEGLPTTGITAFFCVLNEDGRWIGSSKLALATFIELDREADINDMVSGAQKVATDADFSRFINAMSGILSQMPAVTTQMMVGVLQDQMQKAQEQVQARQILDHARRQGGLRG